MLSKREINGFLDKVAQFALANFAATFLISVFAFKRSIEASLLISFIGPVFLAGWSAIIIAGWYVFRWAKSKGKKNG